MNTEVKQWCEQGKKQCAAGDVVGAAASFNQALVIDSHHADAILSLAQLVENTGQIEKAITLYERWLFIVQMNGTHRFHVPDVDLGKKIHVLLQQAGALYQSGDVDGAAALYREVLEKCPGMPTAELGIAAQLHAQYRYEEAVEKLLSIICRISGYATALSMLGSCWRHMGRYVQAIAAYHQAIAADPKQDHVWANTVRAYSTAKLFDQTFVTLDKLDRFAPRDADALIELAYLYANHCRWQELSPLVARVEKMHQEGGIFEPFKSLNHLAALPQRENASRWSSKHWPRSFAYDVTRPLPATTRNDGILRIGYLSSDFHAHATAFLITELFEHHDRARFAVYGYSCGRDDKSTDRARMEKAMTVFHDVSNDSDHDIAQRIRHDEIDILVDLKGYTQNNRLGVMALRPAPVQMHYLGYPGTIGANFIDYFIGDNAASPDDAWFEEKLIRLPMSYQINDRNRPLPQKMKTRAVHGLPENAFIFCNFNAPYKTTQEIFVVWMRLLKQVENSVLWLYSGQDKFMIPLQNTAVEQGIDPARLVFATAAPLAEHLERYLHADLCLDTFPVCSHTTASDALWCGTPLVTMAGEAFVSRVAASLLTAVGLPELITHNLAEYEALALALARDPRRLAKLREHLETGRNTFSLFDSAATTRAIEAAYLHAATLHRNKKPPQPFALTPTLEVV